MSRGAPLWVCHGPVESPWGLRQAQAPSGACVRPCMFFADSSQSWWKAVELVDRAAGGGQRAALSTGRRGAAQPHDPQIHSLAVRRGVAGVGSAFLHQLPGKVSGWRDGSGLSAGPPAWPAASTASLSVSPPLHRASMKNLTSCPKVWRPGPYVNVSKFTPCAGDHPDATHFQP